MSENGNLIGKLLAWRNYIDEIKRAETLKDKLAAYDKAKAYADESNLNDKKTYEAYCNEQERKMNVATARDVFLLAREEEAESSDAEPTFQPRRFMRLASCFQIQILTASLLHKEKCDWLADKTIEAARWFLELLEDETSKIGADAKAQELVQKAKELMKE